jgi:hypothetical protein
VGVRLGEEALDLAPDPSLTRVLVVRGRVVGVVAGLLEVVAHELLLGLGQALVDRVLEQVLEEVEVDEVEVVDATALHAVMKKRIEIICGTPPRR